MLLVLDINETLLDLSPLDEVFGDHRPWFDLLIRTATVRTAAGVDAYVDFGTLGAACARQVLGLAEDADDPRLARLREILQSLPPHPDTVAGLRLARDAGHRLVALGNSTPPALEAQLANSGLAELIDAAYSVDAVRRLKPSRAAYRLVEDRESVAPGDATLIAAHDWDVAGAQLAGWRAVLVRRGGVRALPGLRPDAVADDIPSAVRAATAARTDDQASNQ